MATSPPSKEPIRVVAAVLLRGDRVLAAQRGPNMRMPGLWEFPGGKVEPGEGDRSALRRELREELAIEVEVGDHLATVHHPYETFEIELVAYRCHLGDSSPSAREHAALQWLARDELRSLPWSAADIGLLDAVASALSP